MAVSKPAVKAPSRPVAPKAPVKPTVAAKPAKPGELARLVASQGKDARRSNAVTAEQAATMARLAAQGVQATPTGIPVKRRPGRPTNIEIAARAAGIELAPGPTQALPRRPMAPTPPVDVAALVAKINAQEVEIRRLTAASEKASRVNVAKIRTREEILDGVAPLAKGDWRSEYIGADILVKQGTMKGDELVIVDNGAVFPALLALPRSHDIGGQGNARRLAGYLAVHWETDEDGNYCGVPAYVTREELAAIWAD